MSFKSVGLIFSAILICLSQDLAAEGPDYKGVWRYNVERSMDALLSNERVPQKVKNIFQKDGLPWKNVGFVLRGESVAIIHGREDPAKAEYYEFEIIDWTPKYLRFNAEWFGEPTKRAMTIYFEGNCYYTLEGEMMFKFYFCKEE